MKINVEYPEVMKMQISSTLDISDSMTLLEVKQEIFESFWKNWEHNFPCRSEKHGASLHVTLLDKDVVINSDDELKNRLANTTSFQAVFKRFHV